MKSATLNDKPTRVVIKYHYNWHDVNNDSTSEKLSELTANPTPLDFEKLRAKSQTWRKYRSC